MSDAIPNRPLDQEDGWASFEPPLGTLRTKTGVPKAGSTNGIFHKMPFEMIVPQTDTSGLVENTQVDEIIMVKELGKMTL